MDPQLSQERGFKIEIMDWIIVIITSFPPSQFFNGPFLEHRGGTWQGCVILASFSLDSKELLIYSEV